MNPFYEKVKMSRADSGAKNTVITILRRMQNLYASKIIEKKKVICHSSQRKLSMI